MRLQPCMCFPTGCLWGWRRVSELDVSWWDSPGFAQVMLEQLCPPCTDTPPPPHCENLTLCRWGADYTPPTVLLKTMKVWEEAEAFCDVTNDSDRFTYSLTVWTHSHFNNDWHRSFSLKASKLCMKTGILYLNSYKIVTFHSKTIYMYI